MGSTKKGKNLMVKIGSSIYGFATSCDINIDVDTKEISSGSWKHSSAAGLWKEYDTERSGWTINSEHLVSEDMADVKALFTSMTAGTAVSVTFEDVIAKTPTASGKVAGETGNIEAATSASGWSGSAFITSLKVSALDGSDATYSISLQGTGELTLIA